MSQIDKAFKNKLSNHSIDVPADMWDRIHPELDKNSRRFGFIFWLIAALLLGAISYSIYKFNQTPEEKESGDPLATAMALPIKHIESSVLSASLEQKAEISVQKNNIDDKLSLSTNQKTQSKTSNDNIPSLSNSGSLTTELASIEGEPVNLVITKSYFDGNQTVVQKINTNTNDKSTYDVIIGNHGKEIKAGALLRIVDPLEKIILPAFSDHELKKKMIN